MFFVQISDTHVTRSGEPTEYSADPGVALARCVDQVRRMVPAPEAILASGDLANLGDEAEYERLRTLLAPLTMPIYLIPGNHDLRAPLCRVFRGRSYLPGDPSSIFYCIEQHTVRLIALDTVTEGEGGGTLDDRQLGWLEETLSAAPKRPTIVFMHHPPFRTGLACMDEIGLAADSARSLGNIIARHPCVERILCGHVHRDIHAHWHGTTVSCCPSTAFQMAFDLREEAAFIAGAEPPAYQVHCWNGVQLATHTVNVL
ncbi:MAG TPA: phosphodiesterase [Burkholderiales bacterium]|nr:phosphodiesterase [Burkholderiales bacterium]